MATLDAVSAALADVHRHQEAYVETGGGTSSLKKYSIASSPLTADEIRAYIAVADRQLEKLRTPAEKRDFFVRQFVPTAEERRMLGPRAGSAFYDALRAGQTLLTRGRGVNRVEKAFPTEYKDAAKALATWYNSTLANVNEEVGREAKALITAAANPTPKL